VVACPSKWHVIHRHHTPRTSAGRRRKPPSTSTGRAPLGHDHVVQRLPTGDVDPQERGDGWMTSQRDGPSRGRPCQISAQPRGEPAGAAGGKGGHAGRRRPGGSEARPQITRHHRTQHRAAAARALGPPRAEHRVAEAGQPDRAAVADVRTRKCPAAARGLPVAYPARRAHPELADMGAAIGTANAILSRPYSAIPGACSPSAMTAHGPLKPLGQQERVAWLQLGHDVGVLAGALVRGAGQHVRLSLSSEQPMRKKSSG
jgi:hypothetical protein